MPTVARLVILVVSAGLVAGCQVTTGPSAVEAPADSAGVAFDLVGPGGAALVVPVSVNGGPDRPFVLDTGATLTCLDAPVADSLGLPAVPGAVGVGAGVGGAGRVGLVRADSFRVGGAAGATAYDLTVCTLDLSAIETVGIEVDGLVGLNFLREFRVGLDFEAETLTLDRP